jgi:hypothetical protein
MKLRKINDDCHELLARKGTVLFSHDVPVAVSFDFPIEEKWGCYKTNQFFSQEVAEDIAGWTTTSRAVPQEVIEQYAEMIARSV